MPELRNLRVHEVSGVDRPANKRVFLVVKSEDGEVKEVEVERMGEMPMDTPMRGPSDDFTENLIKRRLYLVAGAIGELYGALMETLEGVAHTAGDGLAEIEAALRDYSTAVDNAVPDLMARMGTALEDAQKRGAKISADRMRRLTTIQRILNEVLDEGGSKPMATEKSETPPAPQPDVEVQKRLADLEALVKSQNEKLETANKRAEDAEAVAKAEREARELVTKGEFIKTTLPALGLADTDAAILLAVEKALPVEVGNRLIDILKAANEQVAKGKLFEESGLSGGKAAIASDDPVVKFTAEVAVRVEKGMTREAAVEDITKADPTLYDRYRAAVSLKV
jgi:hypothetical protein